MTTKKIERIYTKPGYPNMVGDGFRVYNYFPNGYGIRQLVDPFIMLDFNPEHDFGPSLKPRGVGSHPHKGFETVTIAYKGSVEHKDSTGGGGVIGPGDVQWMTAGGGILHKEFHETEFSKKGGPFEVIQLWVNLPKKDKLTPAKYQALRADEMGRAELADGAGTIEVIAGDINGVKGPATTFTEINAVNLKLNAGGKTTVSIPEEHNTAILVVNGSITINGEKAEEQEYVLFGNDCEEIEITADEKSVVVLMSGTPINEPIAQYGPFVMNTPDELQVAFDEFNSGKFGYLD